MVPSFGGHERLQLQVERGSEVSGFSERCHGILPWKPSMDVEAFPSPYRLSLVISSQASDGAFIFFLRAVQSPRIRCGAQSGVFLLCNHRIGDDHVSVGPHWKVLPSSQLLRFPVSPCWSTPSLPDVPLMHCFSSAFSLSRSSFLSLLVFLNSRYFFLHPASLLIFQIT